MFRDSSNLALPLTRYRDTRIIASVSRFTEKVNELNKKFKSNSDSCELFYRGHSNINWKLLPTIYRDNHVEREHIYYNRMLSQRPNDFSNLTSTFRKLVKMQHYKTKTRLLDITSNPLVALYFACLPQKDNRGEEVAGEVIVFKVPEEKIKYSDSDTVSILSNISKMPSDFKFESANSYDSEKFCSQSDIASLIYEINQEKNGFLPLINPEDLKKTIFVLPLLENKRLRNQEGAFILFGINGEKKKPSSIPMEYILKDELRFIIKADFKATILEELKLLGIHKAKLFPELDSTSEQILANCQP